MRLRKLYEIGGAYRATILVQRKKEIQALFDERQVIQSSTHHNRVMSKNLRAYHEQVD